MATYYVEGTRQAKAWEAVLMTLGEKQQQFTHAIAKLICYAYDNFDVRLTLGDAYRDSRLHGKFGEGKGYGSRNSVHKLRLAVDLNLFVDGEYIVDSGHPVWRKMHDTWNTLGGAPAIEGDMNHFSYEHQGHR